jgi:hypothetical protein
MRNNLYLDKFVHKSHSSTEELGINILHWQEAESNKLQKLPALARENQRVLNVSATKHSSIKIFTVL